MENKTTISSGHIIIHVFYEPVREFYDLESLWIDAQRIKIDRYTKTGIGVEDEE